MGDMFSFLPFNSWQKENYSQREFVNYDSQNGYTVELVVPGISKEQLNVELRGDILQISRETTPLRSYKLPKEVDPEKISAELQNGILTLKVPIRATPVIKIEVK